MTQVPAKPPTGPVLSFGAHVLDTLVRPVDAIPDGQGGALVDGITVTAAGTAGATALVLSRLGAEVRSGGVIGDDSSGRFLTSLLEQDGVDTTGLVKVTGTATSATVLPIRSDGSRPALHLVGANALLPQHLPLKSLVGISVLHLGGPEFLGGELAAQLCEQARACGAITSADSLSPGDPGAFEWFAGVLPHLDYFLPNDEQVLGWTGAATVEEGCTILLERGARVVVATAGSSPTVVATANGIDYVPTFEVDVVDTTGCGDSFSAGFLRAIQWGKTLNDAARFGNAVAAHVAAGLGSDFGSYDYESIEAFIAKVDAGQC